jgi:cephalosporin-C deacetylase-like acetyl esterase
MLLVLGTLTLVRSQQPSPPTVGDAIIERYLELETARLQERALDGVRSKEEWEQHRTRLREEYLEMLGLWPLPERTPLKAAVTGTHQFDNFKVENIHFQSRLGLYVTANLYLPKVIEGKLPAVLYACGHSNKGRDGNKTGYQHHGVWFASHGYACLVYDTLQLGEIPGIHHGTHHEGRWWWQANGYTPAGVECWNAIRAIDYLQSRPEIDGDRIAATGRSGGGAATLWVAAADDRIKVAVPVSGMSDWACHVGEHVIQGHCDCMFPINTYRWEFTTITALIAPRPLLVLNSGHDGIFPMSGNERMRQKLERLYSFYTPKPETLFDVGVTPGGHKDNMALRLMAYRWINTFLKNDPKEVDEPQPPVIDGKLLRAFPEDKDVPTDAINNRIDETFVPRAAVSLPAAGQFTPWQQGLMDKLKSKAFREWPEQVPAAIALGKDKDGKILLGTEPGMAVVTYKLASPAKAERLWLLVLNPDDAEDKLPGWAKNVVKEEDAVVLVSPRGCGSMKWTTKKPPYPERALALLGRTVDTGRVWDVQSVARWLHEEDEPHKHILIAGQGQAGVIAAYAALLESCLEEVAVVEPPASHKEGPIFLNVLRVLDVPEALGLLAPRPLTLVSGKNGAFDATAQIYQLAGSAEKLRRK